MRCSTMHLLLSFRSVRNVSSAPHPLFSLSGSHLFSVVKICHINHDIACSNSNARAPLIFIHFSFSFFYFLIASIRQNSHTWYRQWINKTEPSGPLCRLLCLIYMEQNYFSETVILSASQESPHLLWKQ